MIKKLKLKFGSNREVQNALKIPLSPITICVGPNNSGKSQLLRDIDSLWSRDRQRKSVILDEVTFEGLNRQRVEAEIKSLKDADVPAGHRKAPDGFVLVENIKNIWDTIDESKFKEILSNPNSNKIQFALYYLRPRLLKLDAINRNKHVKGEEVSSEEKPINDLSALYYEDRRRAKVRRLLRRAFDDRWFILDRDSNPKKIEIRFSEKEPKNNIERCSNKPALDFKKQAVPISELGDGIKAYTSILISLTVEEPQIVIIDEPEAYLHPSLSYKLGDFMATHYRKSSNRLFASTHSSDFLMGCIQSGAATNILRLTYANRVPTARLLERKKVGELMRDPLLRSVGVLRALFHEYVIVTEGDTDRAFYQEINARLEREKKPRSIPNCLFLNGNGKQTIHRIVKLLREMGIPAAGIYDIDLLYDIGKDWECPLMAAGINGKNRKKLLDDLSRKKNEINEEIKIEKLERHIQMNKVKGHARRNEINKALKMKEKRDGKVIIKHLSIDVLRDEKEGSELKGKFEKLMKELGEYGIFVARGEVECWLPKLEVGTSKRQWLADIFEKMGSNPEGPEYVKPGDDDVWKFLEGIKQWMTKNDRKGLDH